MALRLSNVDSVLRGLKRSRRELYHLLDALPNEDAYATPYSVIVDVINSLDTFIEEIKPAIKDAKEHRKQFPDQFPNRARKWCVINDSRRKPRASTEGAEGSDAETP